MRLNFVLVALLSICGLALASAANAMNCESALNQRDLTECAAKEADEADREINAVWATVKKHVQKFDKAPPDGEKTGKSHFQALLASQRAWLSFRKAQCVWEGYEFHGGTAEGMAIGLCLATMTRERITYLKDYLEDQSKK